MSSSVGHLPGSPGTFYSWLRSDDIQECLDCVPTSCNFGRIKTDCATRRSLHNCFNLVYGAKIMRPPSGSLRSRTVGRKRDSSGNTVDPVSSVLWDHPAEYMHSVVRYSSVSLVNSPEVFYHVEDLVNLQLGSDVKVLVRDNSFFFKDLLLGLHDTVLERPLIHLPSGDYHQFFCSVSSVSDHNPIYSESIKYQFKRNTGSVTLKFCGVKIHDFGLPWLYYFFCRMEVIVVGPAIGGKIRSFGSIIEKLKTVEEVDAVKNLLKKYIDGDMLQVSFLVQDCSLKYISLQKQEIVRLEKVIESDLFRMDFSGPKFSVLVDELEIIFRKHLVNSIVDWNYYLQPIIPPVVLFGMIDMVKESVPSIWKLLRQYHQLVTYPRKTTLESPEFRMEIQTKELTLFSFFLLCAA